MSFSYAQNTLEEGEGKYCAVRLGFRQIDGFKWVDEDEERLKQSSVIPDNVVIPGRRGSDEPPGFPMQQHSGVRVFRELPR